MMTGPSRKTVIGMVHLQPLPGTPYYEHGSLSRIIDVAINSALSLQTGGAHGCLIQTVDRVYQAATPSGPARIAAITTVVNAVMAATSRPFLVGCHLMRNQLSESLAIAAVTGAHFVRAELMVGSVMTSAGLLTSQPYEAAAQRQRLGAGEIGIVADIHTMHFKWPDDSKSVKEVASMAHCAGADVVAVCDADTQRAVVLLRALKDSATTGPVWIAGQSHAQNAAELLTWADGVLVGKCLEKDGWGGPIDQKRVAEYMGAIRHLL